MEVRYAPGDGILLARSGRWLLLGAGEPAPSLLDELWHDLARPSARALVLATLARHLPDVPLAWLDGATGDHHAEGGAGAVREGDRWRLSTAPAGSGPAGRRLVEGVVAAGAVEVVGAVPVRQHPPVATGAVIDGIPAEILGSRGPDGPPAYAAPPAATADVPSTPPETGTVRRAPATAPDGDHDHQTVMRGSPQTSGSAAPGPSGHLQQTTADTVLAVRCPAGHLTDPLALTCRACGAEVPHQEPGRVLRPQLGVLRLPDGELVPLDRPVVLGRRPAPTGPGDWPHLVRLPHDSTYLSRLHARVDLDGWHVMARDLGSRGGTTVHVPGRDPEMIRAHEPYLLEHGTVLDLAGAYHLTYLVTTEDLP